MKHEATTVDEYLAQLSEDRQKVLQAIRKLILDNLPPGYEEVMDFGMPAYVVPLSRYPKTYNGHPLMYAAFASQKNALSLYLMSVYGSKKAEQEFRDAFTKAGKKLDMGKSCVRFQKLHDLNLEVIADAIATYPVDAYIQHYEESRQK